MLNITVTQPENAIRYVDYHFDNYFNPEWLNDPLVKEMILDIDKSIVKSPYCIESPVFGQMAPTMLSGGVKGLILMLKQEQPVWAAACGENCAKWVEQIADQKDLTIWLTWLMPFSENVQCYFIDTGEMCNDYSTYLTAFARILVASR